VLIASIITLMAEAASTSEMLVNFYQTTWCNNPHESTENSFVQKIHMLVAV
jgi:hypothetical protein